jgi:ATP-binding cassette subfamily B protein
MSPQEKNAGLSSVRGRAQELLELADHARWVFREAWRAHRRLIVAQSLVTLLQGVVPAAAALTMRNLINAAVGAVGSPSADLASLVVWLALGLALTATEAVTRLVSGFLSRRFEDEADLEVGTQILEHATGLDLATFEDVRFQDTFELAERSTARHLSRFLASTLALVSDLVQTASLAVVLTSIEPMVLLLWSPFALAHLLFQWRMSKAEFLLGRQRAIKRRWSRYFVSLLTDRRNVAEVKLLNLSPVLVERFRTLMAEFRDQNRRIYIRTLIGNSLFTVLMTSVFFITLAWVYRSFVQGMVSVGDVVIFGTVGLRLRGALDATVSGVSSAMEHVLYVSNLRQLLEMQPRFEPASGLQLGTLRGEVEFRQVSFAYPGAREPALRDISFHIQPGEIVALVGKNGAGKTTLTKLVARFYDPDAGTVLLDGTDLRELAPDSVHRHIAIVFQQQGGYEATAAENIAYGDWQRLLGQQALVERVAHEAGVEDMIRRMPQGFDTLLGRKFGEYDLSFGQWQQLAIARGWGRDASLIILDEPTSSLDAAAEFELFRRMRELVRGKTTILISQRFSTVSMADRILVLDRGRLIETGTHHQLVARGGIYATLYELQRRQMEFPEQGSSALGEESVTMGEDA